MTFIPDNCRYPIGPVRRGHGLAQMTSLDEAERSFRPEARLPAEDEVFRQTREGRGAVHAHAVNNLLPALLEKALPEKT